MVAVHRICYRQFVNVSPCLAWLRPKPPHTLTCACDKHYRQGQCVAACCLKARALGSVPGPHVMTGATSCSGRGDAATSAVDGESEEEEAGGANMVPPRGPAGCPRIIIRGFVGNYKATVSNNSVSEAAGPGCRSFCQTQCSVTGMLLIVARVAKPTMTGGSILSWTLASGLSISPFLRFQTL